MRGKLMPAAKLKLLFHLKEPVVSDEGIDIIIIPAAFSQYTVAERKDACSWLKPLVAATTNDTRVWYFAYDLDLDRRSIWKQLINHGFTLLNTIKKLHAETETQQRPVLFICHCLGGIILKQALWIAHRDTSVQTTLEDVTSGILFLGTPHTTSIEDKRWENWRWILKSSCKDIPKQSQTDEDIRSLAEVCQNFENLDLQIPVLSAFEATKSKVRDSLLNPIRGGSNRLLLVDQQLCQIGLKYEQTFEVDSDHYRMWLVKVDSPFYVRLVKFFRSITEEAPGNVALLFDKGFFSDTLSLCSEPTIQPQRQSMYQVNNSQSIDKDDNLQRQSRSLEHLADFESPLRAGRVPVFLMSGHARNHDFFGRDDDLSQIDETFFPASEPDQHCKTDKLRGTVIYGLGGVGKTQLATEYAFSRKDRFDAIFWVNADTIEKTAFGFVEISRALGLEDNSGPKDDVSSRRIVKDWLSKPLIPSQRKTSKNNDEASWLLIFDNVDDPDTIQEFWPTMGNGCVIVTSRNPLAKDTVYALTHNIDLMSFCLTEAGRFLENISQREYEQDSLASCIKIAKVLGGLPLAITQMGGIIRRRHLSLEDFLAYYEEDARKLHEMSVSGQHQSYKHTVSSVWMLDALSKSAVALLQVISFLDPDRIQESILFKDTEGVELPDYPRSRVAYFDARTELIQSSLISRDIKNNEISIHRLVQDVVREKLTPPEVRTVFESTMTLLSKTWPFIEFDERNELLRLQKCERLFPHVEKIRSLFEGRIRSRDFQPSSACAALFNEVAWYMTERAHDETMGIYASLSLTILENIPDENFRESEKLNRMLSQCHQYVAVSRIFTDSPGALDHLKIMTSLIVERLKIWNRPDDALQLADLYNETAMALMRAPDKEEEAVAAWMKSYEAFGNVPGSTKIQQEWPAVHLALIYALQNQWQKGDDILLPVLRAREEKFGKDSTVSMVTGKVLHVLGDLRRSQGKLNEALDLFQRALFILRSTIGDNHYITADTCYRLAEQLIRTNKKDEANRLLEQSLKAYGEIRWYGPQAARSAFMKGILLRSMDNHVEGNAQVERAMSLRKKINPDDQRTWDQLSDEDFDELVYYYSR